jgi:hypothetical protein
MDGMMHSYGSSSRMLTKCCVAGIVVLNGIDGLLKYNRTFEPDHLIVEPLMGL